MTDGRNPNVQGSPDRRDPLPLSAEGETVDANPPVDEPVGKMPNTTDTDAEGPVYEDDEKPDAEDCSAFAEDEWP